jgi:hypothetical protein
VCPVGAVSKMTWSYPAMSDGSASRPVNSLKDAISVVHEPESCSVIEAISFSGRSPRTGPMMRSRYAAAACSGSISKASSPATDATGAMVLPIAWPNTWPTFDAGSVLTRSTWRPASASRTAVAQAIEVLPTPPLPVKNRKRVGASRNLIEYRAQQQLLDEEPPQQPWDAAGVSVRLGLGVRPA